MTTSSLIRPLLVHITPAPRYPPSTASSLLKASLASWSQSWLVTGAASADWSEASRAGSSSVYCCCRAAGSPPAAAFSREAAILNRPAT